MSKSSDYWRKREEEWLAQIRKSEKAQVEEVQVIYDYMLDQIEKEINSFFEKYAAKEGISMAEAKKRADTIDIEAYMRKAAKYVKEKDFSDQANKEMLLYNMTMKVNRLELLKSSIGLDLVAGHDELNTYMGEKLTDHAVETLRHNAAILGTTVMNDADRKAKAIVNSSFHNATFSDRIWQHQDKLRNEMTNILTTALIGGRNPREFIPNLRKRFDVSARDAERLLRTELARVQTEAQKESYKDENIEEYEYIACGLADCCDICRALDGKHFKVSKMVPGENAPPMHPNCHCSTGPYIDRKEYDEWLDSYNQHHMSYSDWVEWKNNEISRALAVRNGNIYGIKTANGQGVSNETKADLDKDIHKLLKEYPVLKGRISEISFTELSNNEIASARINKNLDLALKLNINIFKNEDMLYGLIENDNDVLSPKGSMYGYLKHEFTHFLEYQYAIDHSETVDQTWNAIGTSKYANEILDDAINNCGLKKSDDIIETQISKYATYNSSEAIAEANSTIKETVLIKEIKKLVKKRWR